MIRAVFYISQFKYGSMISGRLAPGEMVNELRQLSRDLANGQHSDTVILDGPPGLGCSVISTITGVDKVVVTEPSISGFSDLKRVVMLLHHYDTPVYVIINKCTLNHERQTVSFIGVKIRIYQ